MPARIAMGEEETVELVLDDVSLNQGPTCPFIKYRNEWIAFLLLTIPVLLILSAIF